jgi:hypothetical protein
LLGRRSESRSAYRSHHGKPGARSAGCSGFHRRLRQRQFFRYSQRALGPVVGKAGQFSALHTACQPKQAQVAPVTLPAKEQEAAALAVRSIGRRFAVCVPDFRFGNGISRNFSRNFGTVARNFREFFVNFCANLRGNLREICAQFSCRKVSISVNFREFFA